MSRRRKSGRRQAVKGDEDDREMIRISRDDDDELGETNYGYESTASVDLVKSRSKEDIKTLSRNLSKSDKSEDANQDRKVRRKKKFSTDAVQDKGGIDDSPVHQQSTRINNKLFDDDGEPQPPPKRRTRSRSKKKRSTEEQFEMEDRISRASGSIENVRKDAASATTVLTKKSINEDDPTRAKNVLGVFVHQSDCLKLDLQVLHPVVKVSLVNLSNGRLLAKSDRKKRVTSYYETEFVRHVVPLMTQPYDFRTRKSVVPKWDELLLFNDDSDYFCSFGTNFGIFFEILDFVSMQHVANNQQVSGSQGWHRVAWAFLKPTPAKEYNNLGKRLRLQLYKPANAKQLQERSTDLEITSQSRSSESSQPTSDAWHWWNGHKHVPYPSSLYVTVEPVLPPNAVGHTLRSLSVNQPELGVSTSNMTENAARSNNAHGDIRPHAPRLTIQPRLPGQSCRIPDLVAHEIDTPMKGAWVVTFSPKEGRLLAFGGPFSKDKSCVRIVDLATGIVLKSIDNAHRGPIYALDWHSEGHLLSAGSDATVKVWKVGETSSSQSTFQPTVLEHPSYVYAAKFYPNTSNILATAGYDNIVRIWARDSAEAKYAILHELASHKSYINCLTFDIDGQLLFSGDNVGAIRVWETQQSEDLDSSIVSKQNALFWFLKRKLDFQELTDNPITNLRIHPGNRRLFVQCKSVASHHTALMIDLKLGAVMQTFSGSQNLRKPIGGCITPCGTYVFSGSQDGGVYVWDADTGQEEKIYDKPLGFSAATVGWPRGSGGGGLPPNSVVQSIAYHPHDHIVAFAGTGLHPVDGSPVSVTVFRSDKSKPRIGRADTLPDLNVKISPPSLAPSTAPVLLTSGDWKQMAEEEKRWSLASLELSLKDLSTTGEAKETESEKLKNMLDKLDQLIVDDDTH